MIGATKFVPDKTCARSSCCRQDGATAAIDLSIIGTHSPITAEQIDKIRRNAINQTPTAFHISTSENNEDSIDAKAYPPEKKQQQTDYM